MYIEIFASRLLQTWKEYMRAYWTVVLRVPRSEVLCMRSQYSPKGRTSGPICLLPWLFVLCKSAVSVFLFVVVSSWFSFLWIVPIMKLAVFWVVAPCSLVEVYQRFRGTCCLHYQDDNRSDDGGCKYLWNSSYPPPWEPQILLVPVMSEIRR
jgi:hypothetical protein